MEEIPAIFHLYPLGSVQSFKGIVQKMDLVSQNLQHTAQPENPLAVPLELRVARNGGNDEDMHDSGVYPLDLDGTDAEAEATRVLVGWLDRVAIG